MSVRVVFGNRASRFAMALTIVGVAALAAASEAGQVDRDPAAERERREPVERARRQAVEVEDRDVVVAGAAIWIIARWSQILVNLIIRRFGRLVLGAGRNRGGHKDGESGECGKGATTSHGRSRQLVLVGTCRPA